MAKTQGSLFSLNAHGSVAKTITYSKRKSGQQARHYNKPLKSPSPKQRGQRRLTEFLVAQWQNMSDATQAAWAVSARAAGVNLPGYHYFLREAQKNLYEHHGLAGYWHCNEIVDGTVLDLSGNNNHGTLEPSYPSNAPALVDSRTKKFGKALSYDGVDEYVDCGNGSSVNLTNEFTLLAWIKILSLPVDVANIIEKSSYESYRMGIRKIVSDTVFTNSVATTGGIVTIGSYIFSLDTWYNVALVFKRDDFLKCYVNASLDQSTSPDAGGLIQKGEPFRLGRDRLSGYFRGIIDEACVYNRAFSVAEILARYRFGLQEAS